MLFSKLIDLCALYDLHKKRSKEYQFSGVPEMDSEDIKEFYKVDHSINIQFYNEVSDLQKYKIAKFEYQSLIESGNPFNDLVSGEAYLNRNEDAPNVIFVHGWRMDSNERVKKIFHEKMIDLDWNLYYFTLPYHFAREPEESLFSGEYMVSANIQRTVKSTQQAVVDLRGLIHWIKKNKKGPVILIGVSLGGFITNLTALVESEIDVLTSVFYANRLSYSIWNTNPGKYIKKDLSVHGVTYDELLESWKITEPSQATPIMNQKNILLISAKYDQYVHMKDTSYLWEAWNKPTRYIYNCGHAGIVLKRKQIALDTIGFIRKRIFENE
ncbi:alpha/beta hydrolase [Bacillus thuringiensis]|uniref:alpha/beta hydrolase n=1 Tax=Bacillus thuringiensis TaxID=1428 RepID=UPI000BF540EA|nr:alpha/beta hydrolase [Bacillus thuringiensis]PFU71339.1 alpha/beta hydrolase [Bacillus thuringiensis]